MINYAASINQKENNNEKITVENDHNKKEVVENLESANVNASDKIDIQFREILRRSLRSFPIKILILK